MTSRFQKALLFAPILTLLFAKAAWAQTRDSDTDSSSVFSDAGQGGRWIEQFFPYNTQNQDGIHAAIGQMLSIYNTGILVLAGILTLWAIVTFVIDSAHTGKVGGDRHSALYGPLRLVVALGLLVPLGTGYNGAQIVAIKLAQSGSGLANSVWKKFVPATTSYDFSRTSFAAGNIDAFLQQALIDESCLAATQLDAGPQIGGATPSPPGTIKIQAIYPNPAHPDRFTEGAEFSLTPESDNSADAASAYESITTESHIIGYTARAIRVHYNRVDNDDYCGSLDLPVPLVPQQAMLDPTDQTAYAAVFLAVRPELASFSKRVATTIDTALKSSANTVQPAAPEPIQGQPYPSQPSTSRIYNTPSSKTQIEVPQIALPVTSWDALIDQFNAGLLTATDRLETRYIDGELEQDYKESSDTDWIWAGSLFFKLTKLSHDDLKLRSGSVSASLPNPQILPAEMRSDGVLAACPDLRNDVFLPDFHCRPAGHEATLVIKTTYDILHSLQSQRVGDTLTSIDAGPSADRKGDLLAGNLITESRLDNVVNALAQSHNPTDKSGLGQFNSMFNAVNIGNALYLSASSLFHASSVAGSIGGNGVASVILSLFAVVILVPGFFLAVYLPLLPAVRFFLGIATWLITVFEALVALPLIALVQLRTTGEGILPHGRQGWFLLLQMLLRPALMILGLMAAIVIFDALYGFITWAVWSALLHVTGDASQFGTGIEGMLELLGYLMFWALLVYFAANISFNAITAIPDRILLWVGAADMGTNVQVIAPGGSQPAIVAAGPQASALAGPRPAAMITGSGPAIIQQIGQIGGAAGTQSAMPAGATPTGANMDHFPKPFEVHVPDNPTGTGPVIVNNPDKREIAGKPKEQPKDAADFVPPVQGGDK